MMVRTHNPYEIKQACKTVPHCAGDRAFEATWPSGSVCDVAFNMREEQPIEYPTHFWPEMGTDGVLVHVPTKEVASAEIAKPDPPAIAPLPDRECDGLTAKQCYRLETTGCPYNMTEKEIEARGCRGGYDHDANWAVPIGGDKLIPAEALRWRRSMGLVEEPNPNEDAWHELAEGEWRSPPQENPPLDITPLFTETTPPPKLGGPQGIIERDIVNSQPAEATPLPRPKHKPKVTQSARAEPYRRPLEYWIAGGIGALIGVPLFIASETINTLGTAARIVGDGFR